MVTNLAVRTMRTVGLLAASGCAAASTPAPGWKTYANVRFAYSICYPATMTPQPEAPDSDGRAFIAKDGAKLLVYGSNNALDTSVAEAATETATRLAGTSGKTTYRVVKPGWFVVSGAGAGATEFYAKSFHIADQTKTFELTYPAAAAAMWDPAAGHLNGCFHSLK